MKIMGLLLVVAVTIGAVGCSSTDEAIDPIVPAPDVSSVAYGYFGSVELARGSSIETGIQNVSSSSDVTVAQTPVGVTATIIDADDGSTRLQLEIADDAPLGAHAITFDIAGEPEPVTWTIYIIS